MFFPVRPRTPAQGPSESPPIISPTGNTSIDALASVANRAAQSFQQAPPPEQGTIGVISHGVSAVMGVVGAPFELLDTGMALLTSPLAALVPGTPAATVTAPHLAPPHGHSHPPSLIPPAPSPVPLPSIGTTMGAGCVNVLVGGIPAARATDVGLAPTCGSFAPPFEVWTGSSNTFLGGSRAARMGMDITRHCNPASAVGRLGKIMGAAAVAAGALAGGAQAAGGQAAAAARMALQAAADAAALAMSMLLGKDPGIPPSMGVLMVGNPTVLIGGLPLPDTLEMIFGAAGLLKSLKKLKALRRKKAKSQNVDCDRPGHPVDPVTGHSVNEFVDYQDRGPVPFKWERYYNSGWSAEDGPLGYGFRHIYQRELRFLRTRAIYVDGRGREYEFNRDESGRYQDTFFGYSLTQDDTQTFVLKHDAEGAMWFRRDHPRDQVARIVRLANNTIWSDFRYDKLGLLSVIIQRYTEQSVHTSFRYDNRRHLLEILREPRGEPEVPIVRYEYDETGCLCRWRDALGATGSHGFDRFQRMTRETDCNGFSFYYKYDGEDRCIESAGQDGLWHVRLKYEPGRTFVTEADGGLWTFVYDEVGTVTRVIDPYSGVQELITDEDGRVIKEIDSGGREIQWLYDSKGRHTGRLDRWGNLWPTKDEAPNLPNPLAHHIPDTHLGLQLGQSIEDLPPVQRLALPRMIERLSEQVLSQKTPATIPAQPKYDRIGRMIEQTDMLGRKERFNYDPAGNLIRYWDKDGKEYRYAGISWRMRGTETEPAGNETRF